MDWPSISNHGNQRDQRQFMNIIVKMVQEVALKSDVRRWIATYRSLISPKYLSIGHVVEFSCNFFLIWKERRPSKSRPLLRLKCISFSNLINSCNPTLLYGISKDCSSLTSIGLNKDLLLLLGSHPSVVYKVCNQT